MLSYLTGIRTYDTGTLILILKGEGWLTSLTPCTIKIYLLASFHATFFHYENNLVRTGEGKRSAVHDTSPFGIKVSGQIRPNDSKLYATSFFWQFRQNGRSFSPTWLSSYFNKARPFVKSATETWNRRLFVSGQQTGLFRDVSRPKRRLFLNQKRPPIQ